MRHSLTIVAASLALSATVAGAQDLASQVNRVREGDVRLTFTLRPDVCGSGRTISWNGRNSSRDFTDRSNRDVTYDVDCQSGPGRLVISRRDGEVADIRFYVGGQWRANAQVTDLGHVGSRAVVNYLIDLAETHDGRPGREAIFPATLADSVTVWPMLLRIARNERRPRTVRENATFWLGQLAEEPATRGLAELVGDDTLDRKVRESAVFALSQRRNGEGVTALINVVRTSKDPALRRNALFWLAQSKDPRALDLIEELLNKG